MIKSGQFSIIPVKDYYIVRRNSWWFPKYVGSVLVYCVKMGCKRTYRWNSSKDSAYPFSSLKEAQEAIKEAILYSGIILKDELRIKRILKSRKTITVPPWIKS